jgi:hypothetical protein
LTPTRPHQPSLRASRRPLPQLALLLVLGAARPASAQSHHKPSAADIAAARDLGTQGVLLAQAGNCKDAIGKLKRAAALFAAPTIVEQLGACQVQVGKLVAGTENLQRVVRDELTPDAPKPFLEAQARARELLKSTLPRIAHLVIVLDAPAGAKPEVEVDGAHVPLAMVGAPRPTDPGKRVVVARAPGYLAAQREVHLDEGGSATVRLELEPDPNAPAAGRGSAPSSTKRTVSYVLFGVGGAAVATGSVLGILAATKKSDLDKKCPGARCNEAYAGELHTARTLGTGSTVAFSVGAAAVIAATYLFVTSGSSSEPSRDEQARRPRIWVGLGGAGLAGRF